MALQTQHPSVCNVSNKTTIGLFEHLAKQTWFLLKASAKLNVSLGEETLTDINLLTIKLVALKSVVVWKCPKNMENRTGIDWEWWIGSDKHGWRRYAVQAKKLNLKSHRYDQLAHSVRGRTQHEKLEEYAQKRKAIPIYCLYNYIKLRPNGGQSFWNCSFSPVRIDQLGCTVTSLKHVQAALKRRGCRTFEFIHKKQINKQFGYSIPLRCLLACRNLDEYIKQKWGDYVIFSKLPREIECLRSSRTLPSVLNSENDDKYYSDYDVIPKRALIVDLA